jgi:hypothetical protein
MFQSWKAIYREGLGKLIGVFRVTKRKTEGDKAPLPPNVSANYPEHQFPPPALLLLSAILDRKILFHNRGES